MSTAKVVLSVDSSRAIKDTDKLAQSFDRLEREVQSSSKASAALSGGISKIGAVGLTFMTMEMVKKVYSFVDSTLEAARSVEGLNSDLEESVQSFARYKQSFAETAQGVVLSLAPYIAGLAAAAAESAEYWTDIFGVGVKGKAAKDLETVSELYAKETDLIDKRTKAIKELAYWTSKEGTGKTDLANRQIGRNVARYEEEIAKLNESLYIAQQKTKEARQESAKSTADYEAMAAKIAEGTKDKKSDKESTNKAEPKDDIDSLLKDIEERAKIWEDDEKTRSAMEIDGLLARGKAREEAEEYSRRLAQETHDMRLQLLYDEMDARKRNSELAMRLAEEERERSKKNGETRIDTNEEVARSSIQLAETISAAMADGDAKDAARRKAFKLFSAAAVTANTIVAASRAKADLGPIAGTIAAIAISLDGFRNAEKIMAQKFQYGGIVQGPSTGDRVQVRANGGEMVLTKEQQAKLYSMANSGGGGSSITYAPVYQYKASKAEMQADYRAFTRAVKASITSPSFNRTQRVLL